MDHLDDYQDEMERLSSQNADEVLSGNRAGSGAAGVAGAAADRLRQALLVPPAPEVAERHLAAMRAAAGSHRGIPRGNALQRQNRKRFATLGLAATLVLGAGIAAALTLPDTAAEQAKERTTDLETTNTEGPGIQGDNGSIQSLTASEHGKAVSELAQDDSIEGCEHGRAVSDLASSKADDNRKNEGDHPGPCGPSDGGTTGGAAASAGSNGNHGLSNNGNHGLSNNGNHGQSSNAGAQGSNRGGQGSNAGGNRKNELPHGVETAPGQNSDEQAGTTVVPDDLTTTPTP